MSRHHVRPRRLHRGETSSYGYAISDLLVILATIFIALMASIPIVASTKRQNDGMNSIANLMRINLGLVNYAADWNDRQVDWVPDEFGYYEDCTEYISQRACPPSPILGWEDFGEGAWAMWAYWIDSFSNCSGIGTCGNASFMKPIDFANGLGSFRLINAAAFNPYVNRRYYAPIWYVRGDPAWNDASQAFHSENEFEVLPGGEIAQSSYCLSPAAMLHPEVLRAPANGGYQTPKELPETYASPRTATCSTPDLKTRVLEHNWFRNSPSRENPDTDSPWQFNQGLAASSMTLFFDGSISGLWTAQAWFDDRRIQANTSGARGLWSRDTPLGPSGYGGEFSVDGSTTNHHILTTNGIKGRDILSRNLTAIPSGWRP